MLRLKGIRLFSSIMSLVLLFTSLLISAPHTYASHSLGSNFYKKEYELIPGASLTRENYEINSGHTAVNYIKADINRSNIAIELAVGQPFNSLTTITELAKRHTVPEQGKYVLGSINASFFFGSGVPTNIVALNNEIYWLGRNPASTHEPINQRYAFGINKSGLAMIDSYRENLQVMFNGKSVPFQSFNTFRVNNEVRLFTPTLGYDAPASEQTDFAEIVVEKANHDMTSMVSFGDHVKGIVKEIKVNTRTQTPIPEDGFVIAVDGKKLVDEFLNVKVGDELSYQITIDNKWMDSQSMIATGPLLVKDGKVSISMNESSSFARSKQPRSVVGITRNNELLLVTVDGRQTGYSNGISLRDLANYMISLGAVSAINLDGGGSTSMTARLREFELPLLMNRPSEGQLRRISNALHIVSSVPPVEIKEATVSLDSFRDMKNWKGSFEKAQGNISLSSGQEPSVKISYDFLSNKVTGSSFAYLIPKQPIMLEGKPDRIGMWVYGDGRENWLRLHLKDGNSKFHYVNVTGENELNWSGWRYVTAKLPQNLPEPYTISRVYVAQTLESKKSMGNIFINNLEAIYDKNYQGPSQQPAHDPLKSSFPDVNDSFWARENISFLANQKVINGLPDGSFRPNGNITREQAAVMIAKQLNLDIKNQKSVSYKDIDEDSYFYKYVLAVADKEIMTGRKEGYFNPKGTLTRAEAAAILVRAYELLEKNSKSFPDVEKSYWANKSITTLASYDVATGNPDGLFNPRDPVSRAAFARLLHRTMTLNN